MTGLNRPIEGAGAANVGRSVRIGTGGPLGPAAKANHAPARGEEGVGRSCLAAALSVGPSVLGFLAFETACALCGVPINPFIDAALFSEISGSSSSKSSSSKAPAPATPTSKAAVTPKEAEYRGKMPSASPSARTPAKVATTSKAEKASATTSKENPMKEQWSVREITKAPNGAEVRSLPSESLFASPGGGIGFSRKTLAVNIEGKNFYVSVNKAQAQDLKELEKGSRGRLTSGSQEKITSLRNYLRPEGGKPPLDKTGPGQWSIKSVDKAPEYSQFIGFDGKIASKGSSNELVKLSIEGKDFYMRGSAQEISHLKNEMGDANYQLKYAPKVIQDLAKTKSKEPISETKTPNTAEDTIPKPQFESRSVKELDKAPGSGEWSMVRIDKPPEGANRFQTKAARLSGLEVKYAKLNIEGKETYFRGTEGELRKLEKMMGPFDGGVSEISEEKKELIDRHFPGFLT